MYSPRLNITARVPRIFAMLLVIGVVVPDVVVAGQIYVPGIEDLVEEIQTPKRSSRMAQAEIAEPEAKTAATTCVRCDERNALRAKRNSKKRETTAKPAAPVADPTVLTSEPGRTFEDQLSIVAYRQATRSRQFADFLGGGRAAPGNYSKGQCAQGTKDTLVEMGLCKRRPPGDAYDMERRKALAQNCGGHVTRLSTLDPAKAPQHSIIIYKGYAGQIRHNYGHMETKVTVTAALKRAFPRDKFIQRATLGGALYCSDFCRAKPTKKPTNSVVAIYQLS